MRFKLSNKESEGLAAQIPARRDFQTECGQHRGPNAETGAGSADVQSTNVRRVNGGRRIMGCRVGLRPCRALLS